MEEMDKMEHQENPVEEDDDDEIINVDLTLEDGTEVNCEVFTILRVNGKQYIVLVPNDDSEYAEAWFYRYKENPDDPNEEPDLGYIDDDDEYEMVEDAFEEYLDSLEYDELLEDDE